MCFFMKATEMINDTKMQSISAKMKMQLQKKIEIKILKENH